MTVNEILSVARLNAGEKTEEQAPNAKLIEGLNMVYQHSLGKIVSVVNENFFEEIWTREAVAWQTNGEYPYPQPTSTQTGLRKVLRVDIKPYPERDYFIRAREVSIKTLPYSWEWYLDSQSIEDPIYYVWDKSIFIAPQFSADDVESWVEQIKIHGIQSSDKLLVWDTEAKIMVPSEFHYNLAVWVEHFVWKMVQDPNNANNAWKQYIEGVNDMTSELSNRVQWPMYATRPNETHLEI